MPPIRAGLATGLGELAGGLTRGQIAAQFAQSSEAKVVLASTTAHLWAADPQGALITELYQTGFHRDPDPGALQVFKQLPIGRSNAVARRHGTRTDV